MTRSRSACTTAPSGSIRRFEHDLPIPGGGGIKVDRLGDDRADGLRSGRDRQLTLADPRPVDQLADQAVHAPDRPIDPLEPRPHVRVRVRESLAKRLDRSQRATQIVRDDLQHALVRSGRGVGADFCYMQRGHQAADDQAEPEEEHEVHGRQVKQTRLLRPEHVQRQRAQQDGDDAGTEAAQPRGEQDGGQKDQVPVLLHAPPGVERQPSQHDRQRERDGQQVSLPRGPAQHHAAYLHGSVCGSLDPSRANCHRPIIRRRTWARTQPRLTTGFEGEYSAQPRL